MRIVGKSPQFTIKDFELGYIEIARFLGWFLSMGERVLFPCTHGNLGNEEKDWTDFILSRTVFYSQNWYIQGVTHNCVYWVRPKNENDLMKIIENNGDNYVFYIVPSDGNFEVYNISIYLVRQVMNEDLKGAFVEMNITERIPGYFDKYVLPILLEMDKNGNDSILEDK